MTGSDLEITCVEELRPFASAPHTASAERKSTHFMPLRVSAMPGINFEHYYSMYSPYVSAGYIFHVICVPGREGEREVMLVCTYVYAVVKNVPYRYTCTRT